MSVEYPTWEMHVDKSANERDKHKVKFALKLIFSASNNEVEYKAMIHGLEIVKDLEIKKLKVYSDSQLIINQIKNEFQEKAKRFCCMPRRHGAS